MRFVAMLVLVTCWMGCAGRPANDSRHALAEFESIVERQDIAALVAMLNVATLDELGNSDRLTDSRSLCSRAVPPRLRSEQARRPGQVTASSLPLKDDP